MEIPSNVNCNFNIEIIAYLHTSVIPFLLTADRDCYVLIFCIESRVQSYSNASNIPRLIQFLLC